MAKEAEQPRFTAITQEVIDFIILDERLVPGGLRDKKWDELRHDARFMEAIHGAIVLSTELPAGELNSESFLKGVAFGLKAVQDTLAANGFDQAFLDNTSPSA